MPNPRLAERYAKSLIGLAMEQQQLEVVYKDIERLSAVYKSSRDFVTLLKSPVINADKKLQIIDAINKGTVSDLIVQFIKLLVKKGREENLLEIMDAFIVQYNRIKEIHKIQLTTAHAIGEELKESIIAQIKRNTQLKNIELETKVDDALIGGYLLEFNNVLIDESISRDLRDIKAQFTKNIYVQQIR